MILWLWLKYFGEHFVRCYLYNWHIQNKIFVWIRKASFFLLQLWLLIYIFLYYITYYIIFRRINFIWDTLGIVRNIPPSQLTSIIAESLKVSLPSSLFYVGYSVRQRNLWICVRFQQSAIGVLLLLLLWPFSTSPQTAADEVRQVHPKRAKRSRPRWPSTALLLRVRF